MEDLSTGCKCFPGKLKELVLFSIEDKAFYYEERAKDMKARIQKYPAMAKRADEIIRSNEQYQKGLVTARDIGSDYFACNTIFIRARRKSSRVQGSSQPGSPYSVL